MATRLIEMVNFILARTFEGDEDNWSDTRQRIGELLQDQGFFPAEIAVALDVAFRIRQRLEGEEQAPLPIYTNRLYQYLEEIQLTTQARGYLLRLLHEEVISPAQHQQIIERSLMLDTPEVGLEEIQAVAHEFLVSEGELADDQDISPTLH